jgi:hypothetical protein
MSLPCAQLLGKLDRGFDTLTLCQSLHALPGLSAQLAKMPEILALQASATSHIRSCGDD